MAEPSTYIIDAPLPEALDFAALKTQGIDWLKAMVGQTWSNYNDSDPGVTILEQLCYALTELGYCAGFPIEDVLTGADGRIRYQGQFFEPRQILTCSPVTVDDYRCLVHDRMPEVQAFYLRPEYLGEGQAARPTGRYLSWLHLAAMAPGSGPDKRAEQVHRLLNGHRNLGEWFAMPKVLEPRTISLGGTLVLTLDANTLRVRSAVRQVLREYAVAPVLRRGYQQLREQGLEADEIFNGPALEHGWIAGDDALPGKTDAINLFELATRLRAVEGVGQVSGLCFLGSDAGQNIVAIAEPQVADLQDDALVVLHSNRQPLREPAQDDALRFLGQLHEAHQARGVEATVDLCPPLPHGRYRDIENYYSVQNTFPDSYGIGLNSLSSDAPQPRVACARQLKGYLLVFDQLLANQFSQLAHVPELFSFAPPAPLRATEAPDTAGLSYPPFQPTYYSQPLYEVPDAMALLRGAKAFRYQADPQQSARLLEHQAWQRLRRHPGNVYQHGLRSLMESDAEAQARRDRMLSHLMARHGDQAGLYDAMIKASHWYGSDARTRCVVKSLWLDNCQALSSHRTRAFDPYQARQLPLPGQRRRAGQAPRKVGPPLVDGQLNEAALRDQARLTPGDFADFSAFELKLDLLLGLASHLRLLCSKLSSLLARADFRQWLGDAGGTYCMPGGDLKVLPEDTGHRLYEGPQPLLRVAALAGARVTPGDYLACLDQLDWLANARKGLVLIEHPLLQGSHGKPGATLVFPAYVERVAQADFASHLQTLLDEHWPAHVKVHRLDMSQVALRALVSHYVTWHNQQARPAEEAAVLARLLGLHKGMEAGHGR